MCSGHSIFQNLLLLTYIMLNTDPVIRHSNGTRLELLMSSEIIQSLLKFILTGGKPSMMSGCLLVQVV